MPQAKGGQRRARRLPWVVWLVAVVAVVAVAAVYALTVIPDASVPDDVSAAVKDRLAAETAIRSTIVQAIGGLVVILGLGLTFRGAFLTRETHLTDRISHAVDQLGHDSAAVQIGGIHALERLAHDSRVDRALVADVILGYLRVHASAPLPSASIPIETQTALSVLVRLPR